MKKHIKEYHFLRHCWLVFAMLIFVTSINAQKNVRKQSSIYVSNGMLEIAEHVYENGWVKFKPQKQHNKDSFFKEHKHRYGLNENDEMVYRKTEINSLGNPYHRYYQTYKGLKVINSEIVLHERDGNIIRSSGRSILGININITPKLPAEQAFNNLKQYLKNKYAIKISDVSKKQSELVVVPEDSLRRIKNVCLAYEFTVNVNGWPFGIIYVDAATGEIMFEKTLRVSCEGTNYETTLYSGNVLIQRKSVSGDVVLIDETRNGIITTKDAQLQGSILFPPDPAGTIHVTADESGCFNTYYQANDVHWLLGKAYDYYSSLGRDSYNNNGGNINGFIRVGVNQANACAIAPCYLFFGEGKSGQGSWVSADIVAHEYTHTVVFASSNLDYSGEAGGLHESFADIMGEVIENYAKGSVDWLCAAEIYDNNSGHRSFINPNLFQQPDSYMGTYWDVSDPHINSGVQNHWFYLLSEGNGSGITGIGITNAAKIAYENMITLSSGATFSDARVGSIEAANDLFSGNQFILNQVILAWDAVDVDGPEDINIAIPCGAIANGTSKYAIESIYTSECSTYINSGSTVAFTAGDNIKLRKGFRAYPGCSFHANISTSGTSSAPISNNIAENINTEDDLIFKNEISENNDINIYPNPTSGELNVEFFGDMQMKQIQIIDFSGKVIFEQITNSNNPNVNISELNSGIYFIKVLTNENSFIKKIVKK